MNKIRSSLTVLSSTFVLIAVTACGSSGSEFGDGSNGNGNGDGSENGGFTDGSGITPGSLGELEACATSSAAGELGATNLIVMFDRSGSMFQEGRGNNRRDVRAEKWIPVRDAMKAFFNDSASAGLSASLTYFPQASGKCNANSYSSADVNLAALPSPGFDNSLNGMDDESQTPTRPALEGAVRRADELVRTNRGAAIVLVTDGQPTNNCDDNTVDDVAGVARGASLAGSRRTSSASAAAPAI